MHLAAAAGGGRPGHLPCHVRLASPSPSPAPFNASLNLSLILFRSTSTFRSCHHRFETDMHRQSRRRLTQRCRSRALTSPSLSLSSSFCLSRRAAHALPSLPWPEAASHRCRQRRLSSPRVAPCSGSSCCCSSSLSLLLSFPLSLYLLSSPIICILNQSSNRDPEFILGCVDGRHLNRAAQAALHCPPVCLLLLL